MVASKKTHQVAAHHLKARTDDGTAFIPDPRGGPAHARDDLAEELAEEFLASATSGEDQAEAGHEQYVIEEHGGPFVPSTARKEFGYEPDASNPLDAEPAAFPTPHARKRLAPKA